MLVLTNLEGALTEEHVLSKYQSIIKQEAVCGEFMDGRYLVLLETATMPPAPLLFHLLPQIPKS